jgi:hypothetical protein
LKFPQVHLWVNSSSLLVAGRRGCPILRSTSAVS